MSSSNQDRVRRDPRLEWIARNRLHPEHEQALAALGQVGGSALAIEWMGPNGRMRRNPHAVGFIGPNGRKRIDRSGAQVGATDSLRGRAGNTAKQDNRRQVDIAEPDFFIAVVPDTGSGRLTEHDRDLFGLARRLADQPGVEQGAVLAVVFGDSIPEGLDEAGADRVVCFPIASGYAPEERLAALMSLEAALLPRHWMLPDTVLGGGDLGRRLAVQLGERPACGLWRVDEDEQAATGWSCVCRSGSGRWDQPRPLPRVAIALAECAEPVVETRHAAAEVEGLDLVAIQANEGAGEVIGSSIEDLGAVAVDPSAIALDEAEFILSAGNGIRDWEGFHHAARVLGATEGASRVAVDDGFMPRNRQVGATGTWVSARVYVAVGISGAIQHLQGIQRCDKVVAINSDAGCDMVKRADLSVIGDSAEVLQALATLVEASRGEATSQQQATPSDVHALKEVRDVA
uniref:electron transfer flavoprotein subunit alpha/FixB family protein n=1 Tax=Halomonas sp. TaxID=1486246 RepID=UPI0026393996|nr:electron transfer flavoprotein subunit alpha/FixB family protein [Halomonas sp.]